jgi:hypothetical protein
MASLKQLQVPVSIRRFQIYRGGSGQWCGREVISLHGNGRVDEHGPWAFFGHCPSVDQGNGNGVVMARQLQRQLNGEKPSHDRVLRGGGEYHFVKIGDAMPVEHWEWSEGYDQEAA